MNKFLANVERRRLLEHEEELTRQRNVESTQDQPDPDANELRRLKALDARKKKGDGRRRPMHPDAKAQMLETRRRTFERRRALLAQGKLPDGA
jgi:hypothetical protein